MNQNLKHIQLTTNTAQFKRSAVSAICPCMHRMWAVVAGYPVAGGGVV